MSGKYYVIWTTLLVYCAAVSGKKHLHKLGHHTPKRHKMSKIHHEKPIEYYFLLPAFKLKEGNLFKRNGESSSRHAQIERRNNMHLYDDASVFENFDKSAPILWENENYDKIANKRKHVNKIKKGSKKDGGSEEEIEENEMPNTVNPNPNIYGGFPENDVWGNFELPAPETIDRLKLALKMNHHRPSYGGDQASDANDQLYGYEHHALPEYDILETPPFQKVLWQNAQLMQAMKGSSVQSGGCVPGMGSCPPVKITCEELKEACNNAHHPGLKSPEYEPPCAGRILALFGCSENAAAPLPDNTKLVPPEEAKVLAHPPEEAKELPKEEPQEEAKPDLHPAVADAIDSSNKEKEKTESQKVTSEDSSHQVEEKNSDIKNIDDADVGKINKIGENKIKDIKIESIKAFNDNQENHGVEGKVGLLNEEDSLALMTEIGNHIQQSLNGKLSIDEDNKNRDTATKSLPNNKTKVTNQKGKTDHSSIDADSKELTTYFDSVKPLSEVHAKSEREFSDWSSWSKCTECPDSKQIRRRNCLQRKCNGALEEKQPCPYKKCAEEKEMSLPDLELLGEIQPNSEQKNASNEEKENDLEQAVLNQTFNNIVSSFSNNLSKETGANETNFSMIQTSNEAKKIFDLLTKKLYAQNVLPDKNEYETTQYTLEGKNSDNDDSKLAEETKKVKAEGNKTSEDLKQFRGKLKLGTNKSARTQSFVKPLNTSKNIPPKYLGNMIKLSKEKQQKQQKEKDYPENSTLAQWSEWTDCSRSCGIGLTTRMCLTGNCRSVQTQTKTCHVDICADPKLESNLKRGCLKIHNEFRKRHGASSLLWSDPLYRKAYEITDRIAMNNVPQQNLSQYERPGLNLGFVHLNPITNRSAETPCIKAVEEWYGQKLNYDYESPKLTAEDRDFTQLVWKSTKRVGLSRTISLDGRNAYVASVYEPVGNVDSYYELKKAKLPRFSKQQRIIDFLDKVMVIKKKRSLVN